MKLMPHLKTYMYTKTNKMTTCTRGSISSESLSASTRVRSVVIDTFSVSIARIREETLVDI